MIKIPIIGIGAGASGRTGLVLNDMLGMNKEFGPRFLRRYHNLNVEISNAVRIIQGCKKPRFSNKVSDTSHIKSRARDSIRRQSYVNKLAGDLVQRDQTSLPLVEILYKKNTTNLERFFWVFFIG